MTPAAAGGASSILLAVAHDPSLLEHTAVASVTDVPSGSVAQLDPLLTPAAVTLLRRTGHPPTLQEMVVKGDLRFVLQTPSCLHISFAGMNGISSLFTGPLRLKSFLN